MNNEFVRAYEESVRELRAHIAGYDTIEFCRHIFFQLITLRNGPWSNGSLSNLSSPQRQMLYLQLLFLSTSVPDSPRSIDKLDWGHLCTLLERVFTNYGYLAWPEPTNAKEIRDGVDGGHNFAAMMHFNYGVNSGLLASTNQIRKRIETYLGKFNAEIENSLGISLKGMIAVVETLESLLKEAMLKIDELKRVFNEALLNSTHEHKQWCLQTENVNLAKVLPDIRKLGHEIDNNLRSLNKIMIDDLVEKAGKIDVAIFLELFSISRGNAKEPEFLTDANSKTVPLIVRESIECIHLVSLHLLYVAILDRCELMLSKGDNNGAFLKHRSRSLELELKSVLTEFYGSEKELYFNVFETDKKEFDHDAVLIHNGRVLVFEAKASPPVGLFRKPEMGAIRIMHNFARDCGIQGAFNQGIEFKRRIRSQGHIKLYDREGCLVIDRDSCDLLGFHIVCVTRDNFADIATNLSTFLTKEVEDQYPLAINILDLDTFLRFLKKKDYSSSVFTDYVIERSRIHGKARSDDELDLAGYFLKYGSFDQIVEAEEDAIFVLGDFSQMFSEIQ